MTHKHGSSVHEETKLNISARKTVKTTCPRDCYDACGIVAIVRDGKLSKVLGDPDQVAAVTVGHGPAQFGWRQGAAAALRESGEVIPRPGFGGRGDLPEQGEIVGQWHVVRGLNALRHWRADMGGW